LSDSDEESTLDDLQNKNPNIFENTSKLTKIQNALKETQSQDSLSVLKTQVEDLAS